MDVTSTMLSLLVADGSVRVELSPQLTVDQYGVLHASVQGLTTREEMIEVLATFAQEESLALTIC